MLQKKYDDIQSLLLSGTCLMLEHKEVNAGTELGLLLLEVYRISSPKITTAIFGMKLIIFEIVLQLIVLQTQLSKCILSTQKEQTLERSVSLRMPPSMWKSDSLPYIDSFHHNNFFILFYYRLLTEKEALTEQVEEVNYQIAKSFWEEKDYGSAQRYFLKVHIY